MHRSLFIHETTAFDENPTYTKQYDIINNCYSLNKNSLNVINISYW